MSLFVCNELHPQCSTLYVKIHVSPERMALYENLCFMKEHFTTDGQTTRIHCCQWEV